MATNTFDMNQTIKIVLIVALFLLTALAIFYSQFELFPQEEQFITSFMDSQRNRYKVVHISGNAATNDVVQIKQMLNSGEERVVKVLEGYNNFSLLEAGDSIKFVVWDNLKASTSKDTVAIPSI